MGSSIKTFGKIIAGKQFGKLKERLIYAGITTDPSVWIGLSFIAGTIISLLVFGLVYFVTFDILISLGVLGLTVLSYVMAVNTTISMFDDQRSKFIENVLPDVLMLMAANLRSGISTDEALIYSARPEFGFFADKIKSAGEQIATGVPIKKAFKSIPEGINSDILKQTVELIIEGIESGGELASILDGTAMDIRDSAMIRKEMRTLIVVYAAFIFLAVALIAPILYAVSTQLAGILSKLSRTIAVQFLTDKSPTLQLSPTEVSQDFLTLFSLANLIIVGVFGSFMIAFITRGSERYGLRYVPIVLGISLGLFYVARIIMTALFGSIRVL
jgi:archaellum biogenesis protein FlaJ (TadC family)